MNALKHNDQDYYLYLFDIFTSALEKEFGEPKKYWFKSSVSGNGLGYKQLMSLPDESKKVFVKTFVDIYGLMNSISLVGVQFLKIGTSSRNFSSRDMDLHFTTIEEKKEYIMYRNRLIGLDSSHDDFSKLS